MDLPVPTSVCERATKLFQSGFIRPSLDVIAIELEQDPEQGELWLLRATILHSQAKWEEALPAIETASVLMPLTIGGQLVLADCYSQLGKHELALMLYEHLLAQSPLPVDYYAELYAGFKRAGKLELALSACRKAIELAPDNDEAYFGLAHCMSGLAFAPRQVTTILRKALELAPDKPQYRISLAIQLSLTKRRNEAYGVLAKATPEIIETISCNCAARHLLELCAWAGDEERCSRLGMMLAKLNQESQKTAVEGEGRS
ncbi:MAG: hypothetical protein MI725_12625 [Pirellulales bacterium]|nr:hypothetical protein [Pirellulales bacterium]